MKPESVFETVGQHMLLDVVPIVLDVAGSQGNRLRCAKTGREFLDAASYFASNTLGHNHPKLFDPEFEQKLLRVARTKPANSDFLTVELAEFVETFARVASGEDFPYLFFVEGGALAVENALKTAFDWKVKKNRAKGVTGDRGSQVIHFKQAFHGRSGYTLSLTNTADPRKTELFPKFDWPRIINPKLRFPVTEEVLQEVKEAEAEAERQMRDAFLRSGDDIAAIIVEPIQGEGGDNHFRPEFHATLRKLADEFEALLIYDEVQTGIGLTGKMWAHQHYGVTPDIVCFGKKTQVCGIMVTRRVDEIQGHVFAEASRINSTWGGNLTDMVRSARYLEIIEEEKLVENAARVGNYLQAELSRLMERHPDFLSNVRGKGLMVAVDAPNAELRNAWVDEIFRQGALILRCGERSIRFRPSLTFTEAEADELLGGVENALLKVQSSASEN